MDESRFQLFSNLMNRSARSIQRIKAEKMKKYDLTAAHTTCLCRLAEAGEGGLTQGQIIALEGMDRSHISRVLGELRRRGYVSPAGAEGQYRRRYRLTPVGEETAAEIQAVILEINRFVSDQIPAEDIQTFYRTLCVITQNLDRAAQICCSSAP